MYEKYQSAVRSLIKQFFVINIMGAFVVLGLAIFLDLEQLQGEIPFFDFILGEGVAIIALLVMEVVVLFVLLSRLLYKNKHQFSDIQEILREGENEAVEFKSSLRWDYKTGDIGKHIEYAVARTIVGFLNTDGGVLLIGVNDEGQALGLEQDYGTLRKKNRDGFMLHLTQIINKYVGKEFSQYVLIKLESLQGKDICLVSVSASKAPVYLRNENSEEFFIRSSASTQPLTISEAHKYIISHWGKTK